MQYSQLIARIQADIYNNGAELITGDILQGDLLAIISALASAGACYGGIITPDSSAPASLDQATFYIAIQPGTYSSFGVTVTEPSIVSYGGGSTLTFTVSPLGLAPAPTVVKLNTGDNPYVLVPLTGTDGMAFTVDIEGGYSGGDTEVYAQRWLVNYSESHGVTIYVSGDKVSTDMIIWTKVYEDNGDLFLVLYANTGNLDYVTMAFRDMTGDPVPGITVEPNITGYVYSSDAVLTNPEYQNNKVTSIGPASSDIQYPSAKAVYDALITKQDVLVSEINIKTINGNSVLGAGDIVIEPGSEPDNEDITVDSNNLLKFADRPTSTNQKGYVILRKNKTFAEQVTQDNTIYEIRYPFDLGGASVTIPSGCVLKFDGGLLSNGALTGDGTLIDANKVEIFSRISISGVWNVPSIHSVWFNNDAETIRQVFAMNNPNIHTNVVIDGDYNVNISGSIGIDGNTDVYLSGTLKKTSNSVPNFTMFQITGSNVRFFGGVINGNKSAFDTTSEYGHGIGVSGGAKNVLVSGVIVKDCRGDGIYVGSTDSFVENLCISWCKINGARRNGISLIYAKNVEISDCIFYDINATAPGLAIDIEPNNSGQKNEHISILRCEIDTCKNGISLTGTNEVIRDVLVKNCKFNLDSYDYAMYWTGGKVVQLTIDSCEFNLKNHTSSYDFQIGAGTSEVEKPRIVNCKIVSETANGYVFGNGRADIVNCTITSASSIFQYLYANMENCHVDCTAMFFGYGGATDYVKIISGCVLNIKGVTISGRTAATPARNIVFENNIINSNATYYPVLSSFAKNITFRNNVMYLKGTRRCMDFTNADNITISNNRIKIGANYDVIQMNSPATNCQAKENIFEVEDGVTFTAQHYKGINKSTSTSNKIGDPFYEESTGKMLMYNGTAVVNLDGTPLT